MKHQGAGKDIRNTVSTVRPNSNRVIITVYAESPRKPSHEKINLTNKATRNPLFKRPKFPRTKGYDRRAELLAYSREMRNSDEQQVWQPKTKSRPKSKMWKWSNVPVRIKASVQRVLQRNGRQFRYERIPSEKYREVRQSNRRKKKASERNNAASSCCRKLKHVIKEISRVLRCRKG